MKPIANSRNIKEMLMNNSVPSNLPKINLNIVNKSTKSGAAGNLNIGGGTTVMSPMMNTLIQKRR